MKNTVSKLLIVISFFACLAVGFLARPTIDRLTKPNLSDIHAAKVSAHSVITRQADVVMLGDSLTHWGEWSELLPGVSVANRGIAGDKLAQIFDRLPTVYQLHPKKVFITAGTNDLYKAGTEQAAFKQYAAILDALREHGIAPVVQSTFLASEQYEDSIKFNNRVNALNTDLKKYCVDNKIAFVDLNSVIPSDARVNDGIHLNGMAYKAWVNALKPLHL